MCGSYSFLTFISLHKEDDHAQEVGNIGTVCFRGECDAGPVLCAGDPTLVGWWRFDEGEGTTAQDSSAYRHDGALIGDPQWVTGQIGSSALSFDGSDGLVEAPESPVLDMDNALTITAWVNLNNLTTYYFVVCKSPSGTAASNYPGNYEFRIQSATGLLELGHQTAQGEVYVFHPSTTAITAGQWHHVAVTFLKGDRVEFYIDGASAGGAAQTEDFGILNDEPVRIGGRKDGYSFFDGAIDDVRIYSRVLTTEELADVILGKGPNAELADDPNPADEATEVLRDTALTWEPGEFAATHDVYLGTTFEDVNTASRAEPLDVLVSQGQNGAAYDPGLLEFSQTYYWRIDEVNAAPDNTIFKGEVWSFTAELLAYPVEGIIATCNVASDGDAGPENTVDGSGLNADDQHSTSSGDMWSVAPAAGETVQLQYEFDRVYKLDQMLVWNYNAQFEMLLGFGFKDVTVESSVDGVEWTLVGDVVFAQGTSSPDYTANTTVDFADAAVKYVRLTVNSGYGTRGSYGLSEVRFLYIPAHAREPEPADGAGEVAPETTLSWRAGREAGSHEVHLGTDAESLALLETTSEPSATPGDLAFGATYYWRVDEVNEAEEISVWTGDVWSLVVQEFGLIDGFEAYDNEDNPIYDTWIDGWINETGSTVGYLQEPFAERTIVNSGAQSMPLEYDNSISPFYSEAEYDLGGMDLTAHGADTLQLYVQGDTTNTAEPLYVALADSAGQTAVVPHSDTAVIQGDTWVAWQIPLSEFSGVNTASVATIYVGVGDRANPTAGGTGIIYVDDIGYGHPVDE